MTPEQLKLSILQSAFQGKLTGECLPNETADDLYQQIQSEKQRLISEKKIKKEKSLPEISADEIPFDIPDNWRWCYVGDLFLHNTGKAQNSSGSTNGTIRKFITTSNLYWGEFDFTKVKEMPFTDTELERCTVKKGDLLVCEGGDCGRSAVWDYDEEVCIQNHVHRLRPYRDVNIYYFYYLFYLYKNTGRLRGRGVAIQGLSNEAIHKVVLPLAPLEEQHRIVAKIEELLPYVDRYAAAYEKLEQFNAKFPQDMKKSILQYAIQGKLVEQRPEEGTGEELYRQIQAEKQQLIKTGKLKKTRALPTITGEEVPYDFPASWKVCYIDDIAFVTKLAGFEYTKYISDNLVPTGIPLFKGKNVQNGKLVLSFESYIPESVSDELPRSQITKKCLLTPYVGTIGNIAVFDGSFKAHLGSNVGKIELLNSDTQTFILEEYVLWYLKSAYGYVELTKYKKATAQESISIDAIRNVVIAIPPLEEQRRIVAKLEEILPLCERLK